MPLQLTNLEGLARIEAHLRSVADVDYTELMEEWELILDEDNRRALLLGEDDDGQEMVPTLREIDPDNWQRLYGQKAEAEHRETRAEIKRRGQKIRKAPAAPTGPPLVPHYSNSRAIAFTQTAHGRTGSSWFAVLAWVGFVDKHGKNILEYHRDGIQTRRGLIVRDIISHPRPSAIKRAKDALKVFIERRIKYRR